MNITANNVASKLFVAFVASAMLFTLATPAKAATAEELQAQIDALMAQIAALKGDTATTPAATPKAGCTFTRPLTLGSEGADVKCLQDAMTPTYFTNAGGSTGYFGPVTKAAVAAWQTANGVMPAAGYFGPVSQAKFAAMVATTPDTDDSDDTDDTTSGDLSGEASLNNMEIESASDDEVEEGAEDAEVAVATIEFEDGDAMITRLDVTFDGVADVWDVLDTVALVVDGDEVASMDASDEDEYNDTSSHEGTLRFSGLDLVAMEDEEVEVSIVATLQGNIDSDDLGAYTVSVDSMRFVDADDVTDTVTSGEDFGTTVDFTVVVAGADDEIIVKSSVNDLDGSTIKVEDDSKSSFEPVFRFDLDTDDSVNDIELNEVVVTVITGNDNYADVVDDAELVIDGTTIDDFDVVISTTTNPGDTATLTFDVDGDVTIDAGDRVEAELMLKFKALATEGATVQGKVLAANANNIVAEGAEDLDNTGPDQLTGSATGDIHTLRSAGINVEAGDIDATVTTVDGGSDYATYEVEVDVTAFDQEAFFSVDGATSTVWSLEDSSGNSVTAGVRTVVLDSTADEENGFFIVREGETKTFTLTVTYKPGAATSARLQLDSLKFSPDEDTTPGQTWTASPDTDYRTAVKTITD
jgi:hypothetical protein